MNSPFWVFVIAGIIGAAVGRFIFRYLKANKEKD